MKTYRKRPIVVEAVQFRFASDWKGIAEWCGGKFVEFSDSGPYILIHTLEGDVKALLLDWIIRGIKGEFYPCKADIFEATYEAVE